MSLLSRDLPRRRGSCFPGATVRATVISLGNSTLVYRPARGGLRRSLSSRTSTTLKNQAAASDAGVCPSRKFGGAGFEVRHPHRAHAGADLPSSVPTGNYICVRRPAAHNVCKPDARSYTSSDPPGTLESARKPRVRPANEGVTWCPAAKPGADVPSSEMRRGCFRFRLRTARTGGEDRQLAVSPQWLRVSAVARAEVPVCP
jgi:hypothetical protein